MRPAPPPKAPLAKAKVRPLAKVRVPSAQWKGWPQMPLEVPVMRSKVDWLVRWVVPMKGPKA